MSFLLKSMSSTLSRGRSAMSNNSFYDDNNKDDDGGFENENPYSSSSRGKMILGISNNNQTSSRKNLKSTYKLFKQVIGKGSWGIVRKCQHRQTKDLYACKSINKAQIPSDETDILEQEVENLKRAVGHPHLVQLVDVFEDDTDIHIITELLTGGELYEEIITRASKQSSSSSSIQEQRTIFSASDSAWMIRNILDAIRYLHDDCHVVHRDLKASNFLFAKNPNIDPQSIKIIDFGLSRYVPPPSSQNTTASDDGQIEILEEDVDSRLGIVKGCVGTPYYVAPEVLTHDQLGYTNKCDIWSIGVISYLILSATLPFQGSNERETVKMLMSESVQAEYPESKWEDVEPLAIDFCKTLLQKDPTKRPSAREAMSHPWIVKYCGMPPFIESKEKHTRTEKTLDDDSEVDLRSIPSCGGFTSPLSAEDSGMSIRTRTSDSSIPRVRIQIKEGESRGDALTAVPEDVAHGKRNLLKRMFTR